MRFIDLFAGLGGFHVALRELGHECVYACEIDESLARLYESNFGMTPDGDIRQVDLAAIPAHDILCAGFPCQPFSKAGEQLGLRCRRSGDLFDYVLGVLEAHSPRYFILENVPNLLRHKKGNTWQKMRADLEDRGYGVKEIVLSPHQFGIPQVRERAYVVGALSGLSGFSWPLPEVAAPPGVVSLLDRRPKEARALPPHFIRCLEMWQRFLGRFPEDEELPSFPIWSMEWEADYPFEDATPLSISLRALCRYRGSHGKPLRDIEPMSRLLGLPSYARTVEDRFPDWKIQFIRQNRELYRQHRSWMKEFLPELRTLPPSLQKLEWNCKGEKRDIWKCILQFRASGVRAKRPTTAPSLVAMTTTQVPIIAWEKRYMTPRECARLQSLGGLPFLPAASGRAYKALGNAVNAHVAYLIARQLIVSASRRTVAARKAAEAMA